ncbi:NADP-dependent oxidoreductase domain-containing protein [Rhodocollybia butyracea]|uniref:NADP-dependent oxidoreductase domain-containing protein n=1 Tax=Rhodocollybia butyracea TaxID=206335 RepID=A0A9P5TWI1_9AGAR|nr:NADP-dependent oxidoreductase domain-containing protein [Rhodocollybia butyracea]
MVQLLGTMNKLHRYCAQLEEFIGEWMEKRGIHDQMVITTKYTTCYKVVAQANQYAEGHGKTPFVVYQGKWNVMDRSFERDIIPMARSLGLALAPGVLSQEVNFVLMRKSNAGEVKVSHALEKVAEYIGAKSISAVAIAYIMQKTPYVFPIIGGRKLIENLKDNLEALDLTLRTSISRSSRASCRSFDIGFPVNFIGGWFGADILS